MQTQIFDSKVTSACVKGRVSDARNQYHNAWAEPDGQGTYNILVVDQIGAQEAGARVESVQPVG